MSVPTGNRNVLAHAVASSTDPLEIAVILETNGVNDRIAYEEFGAPDVLALAELADAGRVSVSDPVVPATALAPRPGTAPSRWVHLRGLLYAIPALLALSLLPPGDRVASGLILGGLVLSWASGYGVSSLAWSHLGNLDLYGAHRLLRRSLVVGALVAAVLAVLGVFAALMLTVTMHVTLWTVLLLVGQAVYLLAAAALLMTGRELWLLAALVPACLGAVTRWNSTDPGTGVGPIATACLVTAVLATVALALVATRSAAPPRQPLPKVAWRTAGQQVLYGLLIALLVLYPAIAELAHQSYDAMPLSVTLAALPLVLGMGLAETLIRRHRRTVERLLTGTRRAPYFARQVRGSLLWTHLLFAGVLITASAGLGVLVAQLGTPPDLRYVLLAIDYVVLGTAILSAMVLTLMGCLTRVITVLAAAVLSLAAYQRQADVEDLGAPLNLAWFGVVGLTVLVTLAVLLHRFAARPVSHR